MTSFQRSSLTSFVDATSVESSSPTTYIVDLKKDWCIGVVPNGGYLMSIAARSVKTHIETHHPSLHQPDLISFYVNFFNKTSVGAATVSITPLKLGRLFSTLRVQMYQGFTKQSEPRLCFEALFTQGNLTIEASSGGKSFITRPVSEKFPVPKRSECTEVIAANEDHWYNTRPAHIKVRRSSPKHGDYWYTPSPVYGPSVTEEWIRWKPESGELFDVLSLPFLGDQSGVGVLAERGIWFPTLNYGMVIKKAPPIGKGGWEWLCLRIEVHEAKNGRFDLEYCMLDEEGDVVASSRQVALIVPWGGYVVNGLQETIISKL